MEHTCFSRVWPTLLFRGCLTGCVHDGATGTREKEVQKVDLEGRRDLTGGRGEAKRLGYTLHSLRQCSRCIFYIGRLD